MKRIMCSLGNSFPVKRAWGKQLKSLQPHLYGVHEYNKTNMGTYV